MVHRALHGPADDGVPRSAQLFPSIRRPRRCGSQGDGPLDLAAHQSRQLAREYPADAAARRPAAHQRRKPPDRGSRPEEALSVMRGSAPIAFALLIGVLTFARADAQGPEACRGEDLTQVEGLAAAKAKRADDLVNAEGLLWRIEKPSLPASYLYGTIHSTDDSALEVAQRAAREIKGAKVVATELGGPIDSIEKANMTAAMLAGALDRDHDTFEGVVPPEAREPIEKFFAGQGYPVEFAHHLKPWFLAVLTALPACEAEREALDLPEVDQFLAQTAKDLGVKVIGLETPQEQLDAIAAMRPEVAAALLSLAAREPGLNDDLYATMLELY